jgi:predicted Ser/Thr protein kinase
MPELSTTRARYEIVRELGRGGMATVYLARQVNLDRLVALKELGALRQSDPSFTHRFLREARLAGSLSHPNIVTVYDFFEQNGTPAIAMEYVRRGSLRAYVGRLSTAQVGGVLEGLLAGLAHAETHGIVHRDLKPENLLVSDDGHVKIVDFGIAKATNELRVGSFVTSTGIAVGTPNYVAPEQAMGRPVGPWTDLYAVGIVTYELVVGRAPFADTPEPMAVLLRQINEPVPPLAETSPGVPEHLSDWIEWLLAKDAAERPQSAREAWIELEARLISMLGPRWKREATLPQLAAPATAPPAAVETAAAIAVADGLATPPTAPATAWTQAPTVTPDARARPDPAPTVAAAAGFGWMRWVRATRVLALVGLALLAFVVAQRVLDRSAGTGQPSAAHTDVPARGTNRPSAPNGDGGAGKPPSTGTSLAARTDELRAVADRYDAAAANVAAANASSPTAARASLLIALQEAASAYRSAAQAAARNDSAAYLGALGDADAAKRNVTLATQQLSAASQPAGTSPDQTDTAGSSPPQAEEEEEGSDGCSGDSSSDDPSDDGCEP